jgi:hypothetical protein
VALFNKESFLVCACKEETPHPERRSTSVYLNRFISLKFHFSIKPSAVGSTDFNIEADSLLVLFIAGPDTVVRVRRSAAAHFLFRAGSTGYNRLLATFYFTGKQGRLEICMQM